MAIFHIILWENTVLAFFLFYYAKNAKTAIFYITLWKNAVSAYFFVLLSEKMLKR
jgi:hypothetical protein